jgi:hypothetical protein
MLILRGPAKVDLIFPDEPHAAEPPWEPRAENLEAIDAHLWDWMLWLRGKEAGGKAELVAGELPKLFEHLLGPLGAPRPPRSLAEATSSYLAARARNEQRFGVLVPRDLENVVRPVVE